MAESGAFRLGSSFSLRQDTFFSHTRYALKFRKVVFGFALSAALLQGCYSSRGNSCFPAGTKVQTPTGEINVESVKVGDEVLGFDFATGKTVAVHVTQTHIHHFDAKLKKLTLSDGATLEVTPEHPLYSETRLGFVKAGELVAGEQLKVLDGDRKVQALEIGSVADESNNDDVYNLETDTTKNYFVAGILAKYY